MTRQTGTDTANGTANGDGFGLVPPGTTDAIHGAFATVEAQLVGTLLAVGALVLAGKIVRLSGDPLKERFNDTLVEACQAVVMVILAAMVGMFAVVVWRGEAVFAYAFDAFRLQPDDVASAVFTVGIMAIAYALTRASKRAMEGAGRQNGTLTQHQRQIGHHVVQVGIYSITLLVVFGAWGVNVGGLLVGAGFAGIVLGLAARQTLGSVIAGFVVLFSRPFELGDWVRIGDQEGIVTDINIVNTHLRTFDDEFLTVPNDTVTGEHILNRSRKGRLRLNVDVGVDYDTDIETAISIAEETMAEQDLLLDQPNPHVVLPEFGDSSVLLRLRFHIGNPSARKMWKARTQVIAAVKSAFDEADVTIPFPQRELSTRGEQPDADVMGTSVGNGARSGTEATDAE